LKERLEKRNSLHEGKEKLGVSLHMSRPHLNSVEPSKEDAPSKEDLDGEFGYLYENIEQPEKRKKTYL
jgi:hypothetical protein